MKMTIHLLQYFNYIYPITLKYIINIYCDKCSFYSINKVISYPFFDKSFIHKYDVTQIEMFFIELKCDFANNNIDLDYSIYKQMRYVNNLSYMKMRYHG